MSETEQDAADAFGAVGNKHRVAILQALMIAYREDETPLAYSTLFSRVELQDSGQFNYHLQQLTGRFVSDEEEGYALTYAGRTVVSAIASGTLDDSASLDPEPVEGTCYTCGETALVLRYPGAQVRVTCSACDEELVHIDFPPAGVADRSADELKHAFDRWERSWRSLASSGVCPECSGRMVGELGRTEVTTTAGDVSIRAILRCEQCWATGYLTPGMLVLDHPAVVSFFWDRGIDIRERPLWEHEWLLADEYLTVVEEDPFRIRLDIPAEDGTLSLTIDDSLTVGAVREHREL